MSVDNSEKQSKRPVLVLLVPEIALLQQHQKKYFGNGVTQQQEKAFSACTASDWQLND